MQCPSCNTELPKKAKVCPKCGTAIGKPKKGIFLSLTRFNAPKSFT